MAVAYREDFLFKKGEASKVFAEWKYSRTIVIGVVYPIVILIVSSIGIPEYMRYGNQFTILDWVLFVLAPTLGLVSVIVSWLLLFSKNFQVRFFTKVNQYKDEEIIHFVNVSGSLERLGGLWVLLVAGVTILIVCVYSFLPYLIKI